MKNPQTKLLNEEISIEDKHDIYGQFSIEEITQP